MIADTVLDTMNATIVLLSFSIMWYILREISKRLGMALQTPGYYHLYDLSMALMLAGYAIGFVVYVLNPDQIAYGADIFWIVIAIIYFVASFIMVGVTIRYWGWIVPEVLALRKK